MSARRAPSRRVRLIAALTAFSLLLSSTASAAPAVEAALRPEDGQVAAGTGAPDAALAIAGRDSSLALEPSLALAAPLGIAGLPALNAMPGFMRLNGSVFAAGRASAPVLGPARASLRRRRRARGGGTERAARTARHGRRAAPPRGARGALPVARALAGAARAPAAEQEEALGRAYDAEESGPEEAASPVPVFSAAASPSSGLVLDRFRRRGSSSGVMVLPALTGLRARSAAAGRSLTSRLLKLKPLAAAVDAGAILRGDVVWVRDFWRDVFSYGIEVRRDLIAASASGLVSAALAFAKPFLYGGLMKELGPIAALAATHPSLVGALSNASVQAALALAAGLVLRAFLRMRVDTVYAARLYQAGYKTMEGLTNYLSELWNSLPMSFHQGSGKGDLVALTTQNLFQIQDGAINAVVKTIKFGFIGAASLAAMACISWPMTLFAAPALVFLQALPTVRHGQKINAAYAGYFGRRQPALAGFLGRVTQDILEVKASAIEEVVQDQVRDLSRLLYRDSGDEIIKAAVPQYVLSGGLSDLTEALLALAALGFLLLFGVPLWLATSYLFLACTLFCPAASTLAHVAFNLRATSGTAAQFDRLRREIPEDGDAGEDPPPTQGGWDVAFENVRFGYSADGPLVLNDVSLRIPRGAFAALVGPSGAGKTSITQALLRLFNHQAGRILLESRDIRGIAPRPLRRRIGLALQNGAPFPGTVADNIRWRHDVSEKTVWEAAEAVGLHDELTRRFGYERSLLSSADESATERRLLELIRRELPLAQVLFARRSSAVDESKSIAAAIAGSAAQPDDVMAVVRRELPDLHAAIVRLGYAHRIGADGSGLSGGQAQRLRLARILAAPLDAFGLLLLDEPTSALDAIGQAKFMSALLARWRGRATILMTTHRLQPIRTADVIFVMDNKGRVAQQGRHADLLDQKGGLYARLAQEQKPRGPRERRRGARKARTAARTGRRRI